MNSEPTNKPAASRQKPARRVSKRGRINEGRPTKSTPELIAKLCKLLAEGFTDPQAAAVAGVPLRTHEAWKTTEDFQRELARAQGHYIRGCITRAQGDGAEKGYQRFLWILEHSRQYRDQFPPAEKSQVAFNLNQQINNLTLSQAELEEARARLDETKRLQQARRAEASGPPIREIEGQAGHEGHQLASQATSAGSSR